MMGDVYSDVDAQECIPVSGTLESIAYYMQQEWNFTPAQAAKAVSILLLEQECSRVGTDIPPYPNPLPKLRLEDFPGQERKAQGMVADSRVFINLNKAKATAYSAIPDEVVEWILTDNWRSAMVKTALRLLLAVSFEAQIVPDGLSCVCMRAWKHVNGKINIPFCAEDILPGKETPKDSSSPYVCELMNENGRARLNHASWECRYHKEGNYCQLSEEKIKEILNGLAERGVLKHEDEDSFVFR